MVFLFIQYSQLHFISFITFIAAIFPIFLIIAQATYAHSFLTPSSFSPQLVLLI